jgi:radical SAM protein with 4Fe4S-binding SPASM domain
MAYRDMQYDRKTAKVARYYEKVKDGRFGIPISLQVALCDACFNRCIMCGHPDRPEMKSMDPDRWIEALQFFASQGLESVCYSGGDPMAYSGFNKVMAAHIELGVKFGMTITGYVPPTIDLQLLAQAAWVRVSLDAITPEVYEKVRGKVKVEKVLDSIARMCVAGVPVGLGITLHADNIADLPNVLAYAELWGIKDIETHHIEPDSGTKAIRVPEKWERKIEPFQNCHAVLYQLYIDAGGDVYPCCITAGDAHAAPQAYAIGNLWRQSWVEIWDKVIAYSHLSYKDLPPICRECCIQRLSQINMICGEIEKSADGKSFF